MGRLLNTQRAFTCQQSATFTEIFETLKLEESKDRKREPVSAACPLGPAKERDISVL